eukprot:evm.model.scf_458.4 EVM.evm.TU.scf_458.4   scf_458:19839-30772(-)
MASSPHTSPWLSDADYAAILGGQQCTTPPAPLFRVPPGVRHFLEAGVHRLMASSGQGVLFLSCGSVEKEEDMRDLEAVRKEFDQSAYKHVGLDKWEQQRAAVGKPAVVKWLAKGARAPNRSGGIIEEFQVLKVQRLLEKETGVQSLPIMAVRQAAGQRVTLFTTTAPHTFAAGAAVTVSGVHPSLDGTHICTGSQDASTFNVRGLPALSGWKYTGTGANGEGAATASNLLEKDETATLFHVIPCGRSGQIGSLPGADERCSHRSAPRGSDCQSTVYKSADSRSDPSQADSEEGRRSAGGMIQSPTAAAAESMAGPRPVDLIAGARGEGGGAWGGWGRWMRGNENRAAQGVAGAVATRGNDPAGVEPRAAAAEGPEGGSGAGGSGEGWGARRAEPHWRQDPMGIGGRCGDGRCQTQVPAEEGSWEDEDDGVSTGESSDGDGRTKGACQFPGSAPSGGLQLPNNFSAGSEASGSGWGNAYSVPDGPEQVPFWSTASGGDTPPDAAAKGSVWGNTRITGSGAPYDHDANSEAGSYAGYSTSDWSVHQAPQRTTAGGTYFRQPTMPGATVMTPDTEGVASASASSCHSYSMPQATPLYGHGTSVAAHPHMSYRSGEGPSYLQEHSMQQNPQYSMAATVPGSTSPYLQSGVGWRQPQSRANRGYSSNAGYAFGNDLDGPALGAPSGPPWASERQRVVPSECSDSYRGTWPSDSSRYGTASRSSGNVKPQKTGKAYAEELWLRKQLPPNPQSTPPTQACSQQYPAPSRREYHRAAPGYQSADPVHGFEQPVAHSRAVDSGYRGRVERSVAEAWPTPSSERVQPSSHPASSGREAHRIASQHPVVDEGHGFDHAASNIREAAGGGYPAGVVPLTTPPGSSPSSVNDQQGRCYTSTQRDNYCAVPGQQSAGAVHDFRQTGPQWGRASGGGWGGRLEHSAVQQGGYSRSSRRDDLAAAPEHTVDAGYSVPTQQEQCSGVHAQREDCNVQPTIRDRSAVPRQQAAGPAHGARQPAGRLDERLADIRRGSFEQQRGRVHHEPAALHQSGSSEASEQCTKASNLGSDAGRKKDLERDAIWDVRQASLRGAESSDCENVADSSQADMLGHLGASTGGELPNYEQDIIQQITRGGNHVLVGSPESTSNITAETTRNLLEHSPLAHVFFIASEVAVAKKQAESLEERGFATVEALTVKKMTREKWGAHYEQNSLQVMTAQLLLNALNQGWADWSQVCMLVLGKCHLASGDHPYAKVVESIKSNAQDRVQVLATTDVNPQDTVRMAIVNALKEELDAVILYTSELGQAATACGSGQGEGEAPARSKCEGVRWPIDRRTEDEEFKRMLGSFLQEAFEQYTSFDDLEPALAPAPATTQMMKGEMSTQVDEWAGRLIKKARECGLQAPQIEDMEAFSELLCLVNFSIGIVDEVGYELAVDDMLDSADRLEKGRHPSGWFWPAASSLRCKLECYGAGDAAEFPKIRELIQQLVKYKDAANFHGVVVTKTRHCAQHLSNTIGAIEDLGFLTTIIFCGHNKVKQRCRLDASLAKGLTKTQQAKRLDDFKSASHCLLFAPGAKELESVHVVHIDLAVVHSSIDMEDWRRKEPRVAKVVALMEEKG